MLAPIVLFVYNRPLHTEQTLSALMRNDLVNESVLHIYADGAKEDATEEQVQIIEKVRQIIRSKQWCKEVYIFESDKNKGLADSITEGVTKILNQYGKIIVLEDDIVTSKGFLKYMNDALNFYENEERVFHISGYMYPHNELLPETFFFNVPLCWGWATWKRAWSHFKYDSIEITNYLDKRNSWDLFNKFGGTFLEEQIRSNNSGKLKTWFIKWHGSVMIQEGLTLFPQTSLVQNIGFDSSGVHNGTTNNFEHKLLKDSISVNRISIEESKLAEKIIKDFYANLHSFSIEKPTSPLLLKGRIIQLVPFKRLIRKVICIFFQPLINNILNENEEYKFLKETAPFIKDIMDRNKVIIESDISGESKLYLPYRIVESSIEAHTYIAENSKVSKTQIGKFCSIGPNFLCGWGIHPTNALSTSPFFYSTLKQTGKTLSETDKIEERLPIKIGNDVFIGANVMVLDGIEIGDGAVIGAGAIVSKDIPPYAIAVGNPIKVIKYRFEEKQIEELLKIKWWDFPEEKLNEVEKYFFELNDFIKKYADS